MKTFHKACEFAMFIGVVNFLLFALISVFIGGDAINGKIENGHYYLANHGKLAEVNAFVFGYSWLHFASLFITLPLMAIASVSYRLTGGEARLPKVKIYGVRFPRYIIFLISAILIIVLLVFAGMFLSSSNSRDNRDPARQAEMISLVLKWGRLAPFPANAANVSVQTEGSSFTRSFRASFSASKQDIETWIKNSPGLKEATSEKLSDDKVLYKVSPGGGASRAEVTIDNVLNKVEIYVSWS